MRFKLDENLPDEVATWLTGAGHDVATVRAEGLGGRPDGEIAEVGVAEQRVVITLDRGFGDQRRYPLEHHPGFVVLRPERQDIDSVLRLVQTVAHLLPTEGFNHELWIIDGRRVRIRPATRGGDAPA